MKIGFTGTQEGMSEAQALALLELWDEFDPLEIHHGDCVGADDEFDLLVREPGAVIHVHPSDREDKRAHTELRGPTTVYPPKQPLARNKDIVASIQVLVATPFRNHEEQRSGTWATVREARRRNRTIYIIWPDGRVEREEAR